MRKIRTIQGNFENLINFKLTIEQLSMVKGGGNNPPQPSGPGVPNPPELPNPTGPGGN